MARDEILAAIRRAGAELGRAPSRGELRRITGLSHYKVLAEFPSLREAVRAAGLEPNPKGERIETEALLKDWERVKRKLGRRPSRAEYVREGKYSAGAFVARFGAWGNVESGNRDIGKSGHRKAAGRKRSSQEISREASSQKTSRKTRIRKKVQEHESNVDKTLAFQWGERLAPLLPPLVGKRRITEMVAALVVEILLPASASARTAPAGGPVGANSNWQPANGQNHFTTEGTEEHGGGRDWDKESDQARSLTVNAGDGGIDGHGTLQINALVSFKVLFQCKRYTNAVSPSQVRDFRGAMAGRADKGIIITTGTFTAEARREASRDGVPAIELIDAESLVDMLEKLKLGLKPVNTFEIDETFFNEFRD